MRFAGALPEDRGSPARTHVFLFDDVVVKINQQAGSNRLIRERNALALLRDSTLRVPTYVDSGVSVSGREWIVMTRLEGEPPPDASVPPEQISVALADQLGALTAQLHNGPRPPGFGTWTQVDRTHREECASRVEVLYQLGVDNQIVDRAELDHVADVLRRGIDVLAAIPDGPVLAHRDIQPRNVLVDASGRITALLDFEAAGGGDAAEDFKCVGLDWHRPGFASFARAYREAGGVIDDTFADRAALYVVYWALAVLAYLGGFAPWFLPVARAAVARVARGERPRL